MELITQIMLKLHVTYIVNLILIQFLYFRKSFVPNLVAFINITIGTNLVDLNNLYLIKLTLKLSFHTNSE
jgi:hypothetical protein